MESLHLVTLLSDLDGLLAVVARFADPPGLCFLEVASAAVSRAFERDSEGAGEAPWRTASSQRGFRVDLEAGFDGATAHRLLKRFFRSLRGVSLPSDRQWPVEGSNAALRLEKYAGKFAERCEGWPNRRHLLDFVFDPAAVRETEAGDASVGPPPRPALGNAHRGAFEPHLGIRDVRLEVSAQAFLTRMGQMEQALFLEMRLGRPVPESAWLQVMVWGGTQRTDEEEQGDCKLDTKEPEVLRLRLPSKCATVSVAKVATGSQLHSALLSSGTVYMLVACASCASVEALAASR